MRRWGIVISVLYALIVLGFLLPALNVLGGSPGPIWPTFLQGYTTYKPKDIGVWIPVAIVISGQVLLLFLSVDTSFRRLKATTQVWITSAVTALLFALLTTAAILCLDVTFRHWGFADFVFVWYGAIAVLGGLWIAWGTFFYLYLRGSSRATARALTWLLAGSVLELLVAVPCHVIVRRRNECCAPFITGAGIVTGIAVALLCFGPGMLLLYKKRLDEYRSQGKAAAS